MTRSANPNRDADFIAHLNAVPSGEEAHLLTTYVLAMVVEFLGFDEDERIEPTEGFLALGFNSLRAVDFKILLEERLDLVLSSTVLFDCATPSALIQYLITVRHGSASTTTRTSEAAPVREPLPDQLEQLSPTELARLLRRERARVESMESTWHEPLAVVAMACRFPGSANTPASFWDAVKDGRDAICQVPESRWNIDDYFDEDRDAPGRMYTRWGGFMDDVDLFDASFFGISPREVRELDPAQRILLELTWEALERGAIAPAKLSGSTTGVFVGTRTSDYYTGQSNWDPEDATRYYATGNAVSTLAGRIAYQLNLTGPCFALDTACSSSLVALHQASLSLHRGECSAAIVAGVNTLFDPFPSIAVCRASMLAPDGRCKAFDESANGYVRSEGAGVVVLKRLSRAQADGDKILGLVRGTAINQDGASAGLTVPSSSAQAAVIRLALNSARLQPDDIDYVEAHGTGTSLGDPIEVAALDAVFKTGTRAKPLDVGTVKTLIGHSEPAAGIAGFIRVLLSLQNEHLAPNLHFKQPNPIINWADTAVSIVDQAKPWKRNPERPRLAGVSSFGFSGTNGHVIVEEAPLTGAQTQPTAQPEIIALSAKSPAALAEVAGNLTTFLADNEAALSLADFARTTNAGRDHHSFRAAIIATSTQDAVEQIARLGPDDFEQRSAAVPARVAFLFTGQGSQYVGMGAELYETSAVFKEHFDAAALAVASCSNLDLHKEVFAGTPASLDQTDRTQPALFAIEYALTKLWESFGIEPAFVLGHSVGEYAAACCAGVFSLADAARLIVARGRLMVDMTPPGAMLAVLADPVVVEPLCRQISPDLAIAARNCDARISVSGPIDAIDQLAEKLEAAGERFERLAVTRAFHSPLMDPMLAAFREVASSVSFQPPKLGFVSTLEACLLFGDDCELGTPDYWVRHVREPVRFHEAMGVLEQQGCEAYVEIGPAPHLLGLARRFITAEGRQFLPSLRPNKPSWQQLLGGLAQLYISGAAIDWARMTRDMPGRRIEIPTYPFQRTRHWLAPRESTATASKNSFPLLGNALDLARLEPGETLFQAHLATGENDDLRDHRVMGQALFPAAGFAALALAAVFESELGGSVEQVDASIEGLKISAALPIGTSGLCIETHVSADDTITISGTAKDNSNWTNYAEAKVASTPRSRALKVDLSALEARCKTLLEASTLYAQMREIGLEYGPAYQPVSEVRVGESESLAKVSSNPKYAGLVDPALLDGCFQTATAVVPVAFAGQPMLPLGIDQVQLFAPLVGEVRCHARLAESSGRVIVINMTITDSDSNTIAEVTGLRLLTTDRATLLAIGDPLQGLAFVRRWQPKPLGKPQRSAKRLVWILQSSDEYMLPFGEDLAKQFASADCEAISIQVQSGEAWTAQLASIQSTPTDVVDLTWLRGVTRVPNFATAHAAEDTKRLLRTIDAVRGARPRLWFATMGAAMDIDDPVGGAIWGFARTAAMEEPGLAWTTIDLDPLRLRASELCKEVLGASDEREVVWREGQRHVARLDHGSKSQTSRLVLPDSTAYRLAITEYGSLENLDFVSMEIEAPGAGEVTVAIEAAALNFKDVLFTLGMLKELSGITRGLEQPLGLECAGRVIATGPGVEVEIGSAVMLAAPCAMASHVNVRADLLSPKPSALSMAQAAGVPTVFITALYSLERVANLKKGERVLIHAAAGGVGQAAIQVARRCGAEIYATASHGKWSFLAAQGIKHIFDSRSQDYRAQILEATGGEGVDVVLDSMAGDHVAASLAALGKNGRFVELGKLGVWTADQMQTERPDVAYSIFDMADVLREDVQIHAALMKDILDGFDAADFSAPPTRTFDGRDAQSAFRHLAQARNLGKLVLAMPPAGQSSSYEVVRPGNSYVVTGGLGALGLHMATWLAGEGAGEVLLLSRSKPDPETAERLEFLRSSAPDMRLHSASVDVADAEALGAALGSLKLPLAGVVHAAGCLDDGLIGDMTWPRFETVMEPKWTGAWNLHAATSHLELDFFVMFSSMTAMVGAAGQGNYAAANAGLDSFAEWRRSQGLQATSIAWGPWSGGGMATRVGSNEALEGAGVASLSPTVAMSAFAALMRDPDRAAVIGALAINWPRYLARRATNPLFERLQSAGAKAQQAAKVTVDFNQVPAEELPAAVREVITGELAGVLGYGSASDVDTSVPFADLGIDSLLAVDMRNRLEAAMGFELPVTLLFDHDNLDSLISYLIERIGTGTANESADNEATLMAEIENLSDEEVERLLAEEDLLDQDS